MCIRDRHIVVRLEPHLAPVGEQGVVDGETAPVGEAALKLPVLVPGVAEVDVDAPDLAGQEDIGQAVGVAENEAQVGQPGLHGALGGDDGDVRLLFHRDKIDVGMQFGKRADKRALAAAEFQVQRRAGVGKLLALSLIHI